MNSTQITKWLPCWASFLLIIIIVEQTNRFNLSLVLFLPYARSLSLYLSLFGCRIYLSLRFLDTIRACVCPQDWINAFHSSKQFQFIYLLSECVHFYVVAVFCFTFIRLLKFNGLLFCQSFTRSFAHCVCVCVCAHFPLTQFIIIIDTIFAATANLSLYRLWDRLTGVTRAFVIVYIILLSRTEIFACIEVQYIFLTTSIYMTITYGKFTLHFYEHMQLCR